MINQRGPVIHKNANPSPRGNHLISSRPFYGNHRAPRLDSAGDHPRDGAAFPPFILRGRAAEQALWLCVLELWSLMASCVSMDKPLNPLGLNFLTREMGRTALAPDTCCEHEMEALGLCLAGGGHPRMVGSPLPLICATDRGPWATFRARPPGPHAPGFPWA